MTDEEIENTLPEENEIVFHKDHYDGPELQVVIKKLGIDSFSYNPETHILETTDVDLTKITLPTKEEIKDLVDKYIKDETISIITSRLNDFCKEATDEIKELIAGRDSVPDDQIERYNSKSRIVLSGKLEYIKEEAEISNIDTKQLSDKIKNNSDSWRDKVDMYNCGLEAIRIKLLKYIKVDKLELVNYILNYFTIEVKGVKHTTIEILNKSKQYFIDIEKEFDKEKDLDK